MKACTRAVHALTESDTRTGAARAGRMMSGRYVHMNLHCQFKMNPEIKDCGMGCNSMVAEINVMVLIQ